MGSILNRRRLIAAQPHLASASGSIVSVDDAVAAALKSCIVNIQPVQDLHGYDNPWPAGGGKNLIPYPYYTSDGTISGVPFSVASDGKITASGTTTSGANFVLAYGISLKAGTYTLSVKGKHIGMNLYARDITAQEFLSTVASSGSDSHNTFTIANDLDNVNIYFNIGSSGISIDLSVYVQLESGSSPTSYAPYSNICPISGRTAANVWRTGKNLFDKANPNIIEAYFGAGNPSNIIGGVSFRTVYIPACPNTTYTVKNNASNRLYVGYNDIAPISGGTLTKSIASVAGVATITTDGNAHYLAAYVYNSNADTVSFDDVLAGLQIEIGSTATAYEPYSGTTIPITFPTPPATVYGGTLDLVSGKLTVTQGVYQFTGTENWVWVSGTYPYWHTTVSIAAKSGIYEMSSNGLKIQIVNSNIVRIYPHQNTITITDQTDMNALCNTEAQFVYNLATPVTYQLTPQEISTLVGRNVMWTDGDGLSVQYWAHP